MDVFFWFGLLFICYTYIGYPLMLGYFRSLRKKPVLKRNDTFSVTVVIAARNEARRLCERIRNLCEQSFPQENLDIVVVSDGSTDETKQLIETMSNPRVTLVELVQSHGKAVAVNVGVEAAKGQIIVFTDARQTFAPDAISELVANFADPSVGGVSGELFFRVDAESTVATEMGAYWKYEKWIRKAESSTGSVVGATGSIYAVRKPLYQPLPAGTVLDDVLTPLRIVRQGYRVLFEEKARAFDIVSKDVSQEWTRKVRTLAGNWQLLSLEPLLLSPWHNPLWWRFLSHKIFRLLIPFALVGLLYASIMLDGLFYRSILVAQAVFYGAAALTGAVPKLRSFRLPNFCYFFMVMNAAAVAGFCRWASGRSSTAWKPAYTKVTG